MDSDLLLAHDWMELQLLVGKAVLRESVLLRAATYGNIDTRFGGIELEDLGFSFSFP